jgi:hypothetical protein
VIEHRIPQRARKRERERKREKEREREGERERERENIEANVFSRCRSPNSVFILAAPFKSRNG